MMSIDSRNRDIIDKYLVASPFGQKLGVELVSADRDSIKLKLPFQTENVTLNKTVHGGAIATLIDIAAAIAAVSNKEPETPIGGATSILTVSYLMPADGIDLIASAKVLWRKNSKVVSEVLVHDLKEDIFAIAQVITHLVNSRDKVVSALTIKDSTQG